MTIAGKLVDSIEINASRVREETYLKGLEDHLRCKYHGAIIKLKRNPCFCIIVPTKNAF
jgi:hypothetical protein